MKLLTIFIFITCINAFSQSFCENDTVIERVYDNKQNFCINPEFIYIIQNESDYIYFFNKKSNINFNKKMMLIFYVHDEGDIINVKLKIDCDNKTITYILFSDYIRKKRYRNYTSSAFIINKGSLDNVKFKIVKSSLEEAIVYYNNNPKIDILKTNN